MNVAAGGKIKQVIKPDDYPRKWLVEKTTVFNVQILNTEVYRTITGCSPPKPVIDAATYSSYGLPFFFMEEEPSGVSGDFDVVKSIAEIEGEAEEKIHSKMKAPADGRRRTIPDRQVPLANPAGPLRKFRTCAELEKQFSKINVASF